MKKNNSGSALLMVIIAMCFIGILGSLVLSLTVTNIQMKQVDYQSKTNFYGSETVIEELRAGLERISSECMYTAYTYMLLNYVEITTSTDKTLKGEFDKKYIETLVIKLGDGVDPDSYDPANDDYEYDTDVLRATIATSPESFLNTNDSEVSNPIKIKLDTDDNSSVNSITLKGIRIRYTDSKGFETFITTDINMESPNLNFDSANTYPEYTKYALIADNKLSINSNPTGLNINGNIYAGAGGVLVFGNLKINGDMLITRGDITVLDYGTLEIGSEHNPVNIWAENITTQGNLTGTDTCDLTIYGNCRVADDLTLGAKSSVVTIGGTYYGYTYNKMLEELVPDNPSNLNKSSAILINGLNSSLNLENLRSLIIAGNAFVSRKSEIAGTSGASDIRMGESIAVKSNQLAYLVPNEYITGGQNPMTQFEIAAQLAIQPGTEIVDFSSAPAKLTDLLTNKGYTEYYYNIGGVSIVYYYLEFKDQQSANKFFKRYFSDSENKNNIVANAKTYFMDGGSEITLNNNLILAAHAMKKNTDNSYGLSGGVLPDMNNLNENLYKDALHTAKEYFARQLGLIETTSHTITDIGLEDKYANPLFKTIISHDDNGTPMVDGDDISFIKKEASGNAHGFKTLSGDTRVKPIGIDLSGDGNYDCYVFIVYNPTDEFVLTDFVLDSVSYPMSNPVDSPRNKGIVITTGDIKVAADYEGLIISGGTIKLESNNITVQANPSLIQEILSYALEMERTSWADDNTKKFTHYFTAYTEENSGAGEKIDQVEISKYLTFENWKKNAE